MITIKRTYPCSECHKPIEIKSLLPPPEIDRICDDCIRNTNIYIFVDRDTGKEVPVRAGDVELASLRAWKINLNLKFKIPQSS